MAVQSSDATKCQYDLETTSVQQQQQVQDTTLLIATATSC